MNSKPKAIILGGTNPHITLIKNLKERGYYTVLVDYYENPPAKNFADKHIKESTLDQKKVLNIAKKLNAKLVISAAVDQANLTACYVAEKLGLPAPYSYKTALNVTNKGLMKKKMTEAGIPTSKYVFTDNIKDFKDSKLKFPVIVKPADSCGSKGVRKANNLFELNKYFKKAIDISRTNKAIIEEFKKGVEYSFYYFVQNKKINLIMIAQKFEIINNDKRETIHDIPQTTSLSMKTTEFSQKNRKKMEKIVNEIANTFELNNTPLLVQAIIDKEDINIIEFAPRTGGGLGYRTIKLNTGFDILNATIDSYLGCHVNIKHKSPRNYYFIEHVYVLPGLFDCITGFEDLKKQNIIEEFYYHKASGATIGPDMIGSNRVGSFIIKADNKKDLFKKREAAIAKLEAYDVDGNSIMRKNTLKKIKI